MDPFNGVATTIFVLAVLHTFMTARFTKWAHDIQARADARAVARGEAPAPRLGAEILHFFGEVEVIFGLWGIALVLAIAGSRGWDTAAHYLNDTVNYTEPLFVVVIMAIAATRPVIVFAESGLQRLAALGGGTPAAWWITILSVGPLIGSFITEPAAMTICAMLLARKFYALEPSMRLRLATIGLLFVNVSIGGTLTHFAAPPVLMVARPWGWDTAYMLGHFGWRAVIAILASNLCYYMLFRSELRAMKERAAFRDAEQTDRAGDASTPILPIPTWVTVTHLMFMAWTVVNAHYPVLFVGGFMFFLGFLKASSPFQGQLELRSPLLVGFFLAGLVVHGGLQAWWIAPVLASLSETPLFVGATVLTAFNDNALITYLATLVPELPEALKVAVVEGAVTGGGLTIIANAPNPAGHAVLARFFGGAVPPLGLGLAALLPTAITSMAFRLV